jgi:peptide/nickel transport system substrate-binding protein
MASSPVQAESLLRVAVNSCCTTLDPVKMRLNGEQIVAHLVYDGLTTFDSAYNVQPDLAERWESSPDFKTWVFHLRPGVKFSNGRVLDAEDAVASYRRVMDPANGSVARVNFAIVDTIAAVDSTTVQFTLKIPYSSFPAVLGGNGTQITPRDMVGSLSTQPVGTGPFILTSFKTGDRVELRRNPAYFVAGEPKLDGVTISVIPETASAIAALIAGDIDLAYNIPGEAEDQLKDSKIARVDRIANGKWLALVMRNDTPPFNDVRVRRALVTLLDKEELADLATLGHGVATHTSIPPSSPYYDTTRPIPKPDPAAARQMLVEAGVHLPLALTVWVPAGNTIFERLALGIRDEARKADVNIEIRSAPSDKFFGEIEGKEPLTITSIIGRPTPDTMLYAWFHSTGSWNLGLWKYHDASVDTLLDQARLTSDELTLKTDYVAIQEKILSDPPGAVILFQNHANGVANRVHGFHTSPIQWLDLATVTVY